jgi:hypothetical protein
MMNSNQERLGIFPYQRRSTRLSKPLTSQVPSPSSYVTPTVVPPVVVPPCRFRSMKNQNNGTNNPHRHPPSTFDCRPMLRCLPLTLVLGTTEHVQIHVSTGRRRLPTDGTSVCPTNLRGTRSHPDFQCHTPIVVVGHGNCQTFDHGASFLVVVVCSCLSRRERERHMQ